ncbi:hypothetical protein M9H77_18721 [Catharanthus roseus]|uniref:Uncharacterized protein n=1 Tax=Catharanthus roseus TaxID=4058 RepID=A0ACC0B8B0_CATRO|nr:hypothetical protein M9H77_18721 [Catharanthus roseus]
MSVMSKIAGSRQKRPEKSRPPTNPTQRKKSKNEGWEQTGPADGGPQDPVIVPSYSGHVASCIWRGQDRGILKSRSRYVSLTGWTPSDPAVVWIYMYFPMFAPLVRAGARLCKPYIQRFAMFGHETEKKLIDLRIRLDTMTADEALWLEAPSHLLTSTWTSIPAIPPTRCTDDYMPWFLPRTHPRIQNPDRLPRGVQLPTIAHITPDVLLDMVARELDRDDIDDATKCMTFFCSVVVTWLMRFFFMHSVFLYL